MFLYKPDMNERYSINEEVCDAGHGPYVEYEIWDEKSGCAVGVMHDRRLAELVVDTFNRSEVRNG